MSKPKQVQETKNTYTDWSPRETQYAQRLNAMPDMPESLQPALQAQFDRAQAKNAARLNSSYVGNVPVTARMAMQQQGDRDLTADYGAALRQSAFDASNAAKQKMMFLDEAYRARPLQTSGTATSQQKGFDWGGLLQGGLGLASSFI